MSWLKNTVSGPVKSVSATSPARLLAKSLTDRETRDEWRREHRFSGYCSTTIYNNAARDLTVSSSMSAYCDHMISTPFTLSKDEQSIVHNALREFDRRLSIEAEQRALTRLVAPPKKSTRRKEPTT